MVWFPPGQNQHHLQDGGTVPVAGHGGRRVSRRSKFRWEQKARSRSISGISTGLSLIEKGGIGDSGTARALMGVDMWWV